jgi:hypothetical protein
MAKRGSSAEMITLNLTLSDKLRKTIAVQLCWFENYSKWPHGISFEQMARLEKEAFHLFHTDAGFYAKVNSMYNGIAKVLEECGSDETKFDV